MNNKFLAKRSLIILIVFTVMLIILVFAIAYAYFASQINIENVANVTTSTGTGTYVFTVYVDGNIDYMVTQDMMSTENISTTPVGSDNASILVNLSSPDSNTKVECTYDIIWEWTSMDQYTQSTADLDSLSASGYPFEFSVSADDSSVYALPQTDLSKFAWSNENGEVGNNTSIVKGAKIESVSQTPTQVIWDVCSNLYNIPSNQNSLGGKHYESKIYVDNIDCTLSENLSD